MKRHPMLSQMSAYRRLAMKARYAGNFTQAKHYDGVADRAYSSYCRQKKYNADRKATRNLRF